MWWGAYIGGVINGEMNMDIAQFEEQLNQKVKDFFSDWRANSEEDPKSWPTDMGLADWYEAFIMTTEGD